MSSETLCKRCGKCCYYVINGRKKKCRFLVKIGSKDKNICRIYDNRLGRVIDTDEQGKNFYCFPIDRQKKLNRLPQGCGYIDEVQR